jgi:hypothetical protein
MRATTFVPLVLGAAGACNDYNPIGEDPVKDPVFNPYVPETPTNIDSYEQIQKPQVDILWVVDNSCSMLEEQTGVATNFPVFMDFFLGSGLDYHIGVVSTDMMNDNESGKLITANNLRWITPETPNPEEVFAAMSQLGTGGSGDEQGVLAAYAAFELQTDWNEGFFRDDAAVHVITVSDEPDNSPTFPVTDNEFAEYLNGLRDDPQMVQYHSIVGPPPPEWPCDGVASSGTDYIAITDKVGGVFWSLCKNDWIGALEMIGLDTAGLKREYFLSERPVEGTIEVTIEENGYTIGFDLYDETTSLGDYTYNEPRNSVTFLNYVPNPGAVVHIEYDVLAAVERE